MSANGAFRTEELRPRLPGRSEEVPYAPEAERALLGAVLVAKSIVGADVDQDDFLAPAHRHIWQAILSVAERGEPIDKVSVATEMRQRKTLATLDNGELYLMELEPEAESEIPRYAALVRRAAGQRRAIASAAELSSRLYNGDPDGARESACEVLAALDSVGGRVVELHPWADPRPLALGLPPVPAFHFALLPEVLRDWVTDSAQRAQVAPDFIAAGAMVALGSVIGRGCGIKPRRRDDWTVVPNIWGAIVGAPSTKKSTAIDVAMAPLKRLAVAAAASHEAILRHSEFESQVLEAQQAEARKRLGRARPEDLPALREIIKAKISAPIPRRHLVNDATVEKLGIICQENPRGFALVRDELTGWFSSLSKDGHECDRAFFLEAWSGLGSYTYDRIARGTVHVPAVCVSVFGGIQPGPLGAYLKSALRGGQAADGLLQRFQLCVWPDTPAWEHVDRRPHAEARDRAYGLFERMASLQPGDVGAEQTEFDPTPTLRFSHEAQEFFDSWNGDLERRLRSGVEHEVFESHLGKYRKLMPAIALICHLSDSTGHVSIASAARAAAWCTYLEAHGRRLYGSIMRADDLAAASLLERVRSGELEAPIVTRDVYRRCWTGLATPEDADAALGVLEHHGYVRRVETKTAGRPRVEFEVHPSLRKDASR